MAIKLNNDGRRFNMIKVMCIQRFTNNRNQIYGYRIQDQQGKVMDIDATQLKVAIANNKISVINLRLTSDNRLLPVKPDNEQQQSTNSTTKNKQQQSVNSNDNKSIDKQINAYIEKAKSIGIEIKEIQTYNNKPCYLVSETKSRHKVLIPSNVTKLDSVQNGSKSLVEEMKNLHGSVSVIGGSGLQDLNYMFYNCKATTLDLSLLDTSNVNDMFGMFRDCKAKTICVSKFNTSKVTNMGSMFEDCKVTELDLSSFDTSNATDMCGMFKGCKATTLDLSSFNTSHVTRMGYTFSACEANEINISSFDTSNVTSMSHMFELCKATTLDIS